MYIYMCIYILSLNCLWKVEAEIGDTDGSDTGAPGGAGDGGGGDADNTFYADDYGNINSLDNMDDVYLREEVLPAITVQATIFAIMAALTWGLCMMRARQYQREVEEFIEAHPVMGETGAGRGSSSSGGRTVMVASPLHPEATVTTVSQPVAFSAATTPSPNAGAGGTAVTATAVTASSSTSNQNQQNREVVVEMV